MGIDLPRHTICGGDHSAVRNRWSAALHGWIHSFCVQLLARISSKAAALAGSIDRRSILFPRRTWPAALGRAISVIRVVGGTDGDRADDHIDYPHFHGQGALQLLDTAWDGVRNRGRDLPDGRPRADRAQPPARRWRADCQFDFVVGGSLLFPPRRTAGRPVRKRGYDHALWIRTTADHRRINRRVRSGAVEPHCAALGAGLAVPDHLWIGDSLLGVCLAAWPCIAYDGGNSHFRQPSGSRATRMGTGG